MTRSWLITGASRGLGRAFALELDVTDRDRAFQVAEQAIALASHLDVVINCPGYGLHAPIG